MVKFSTDYENFEVSPSPTLYDLGKDLSEPKDPGSESERSKSQQRSTIVRNIVRENTSRSVVKQMISEEKIRSIILPWSRSYKAWWSLLVLCRLYNFFWTTSNSLILTSSILEYALTPIFVVDMFINFNLAFYNERDEVVYHRGTIARKYLRKMFWIDLIGIFPFYTVALALSGELGQDSTLAQYLALFRLFRWVRLYRVDKEHSVQHRNFSHYAHADSKLCSGSNMDTHCRLRHLLYLAAVFIWCGANVVRRQSYWLEWLWTICYDPLLVCGHLHNSRVWGLLACESSGTNLGNDLYAHQHRDKLLDHWFHHLAHCQEWWKNWQLPWHTGDTWSIFWHAQLWSILPRTSQDTA